MLVNNQKQNFISTFSNSAATAILHLNNLQEILAFAQANGFLSEEGITDEDLAGTEYDGLEPAKLLEALTAVASVVMYLQSEGIYGKVAPILVKPAV